MGRTNGETLSALSAPRSNRMPGKKKRRNFPGCASYLTRNERLNWPGKSGRKKRWWSSDGRKGRGRWSGRRESNSQPTAWKAVTLPLSYSRKAFSYFHFRSRSRPGHPSAGDGGEGRIRTFEATRATDLQSAAFDRSATSPCARP